MQNLTENKYIYLYNTENVLTHFSEAIRGDDYKMYPNEPLDYTFKKGTKLEYFSLKNNSTSGGESAEHYNAKMEIAKEKKYYDTIFKETVYFNKVVPEKFLLENKKPDLSCYDENDNLVCIIEILYSNKKTFEDIEKLKSNKVAVIEIDIKNGNKCEHLILPTLLESNRAEYNNLEVEKQELDLYYKRIEAKLRVEYFTAKQRLQAENFTAKDEREIEYRNELVRAKINEINMGTQKSSTGDSEAVIRISKITNRIEQSINESRRLEKSFKKIGQNCKIEWFRNKWMTNKVFNKIDELIYWTS